MEGKMQTDSERLKVMVAVTDSPESRVALCWAVENLVCKGDWLLLYHTVKTPDLIPTAMGKVPFIGASSSMQKAHVSVAIEDANRLLASLEAYCTSKKIFPFTEVGRCEERKDDIVRKVRAEGITHLVMGTKKRSRFKSWGWRRSLTSRICQELPCHVTLVDIDSQATLHSKVKVNGTSVRHKTVSLSHEALDILKESGLRSLSSETAVKESPAPETAVNGSPSSKTAVSVTPVALNPAVVKRSSRPNYRYDTPTPTRQSFGTFMPPPGSSGLATPPTPPMRHSTSTGTQDPDFVLAPGKHPYSVEPQEKLSRHASLDADDIKHVLTDEEPSKETETKQRRGHREREETKRGDAARLRSARHFYSSPARIRNESVFVSEGSEDESERRDYSFSGRLGKMGAREERPQPPAVASTRDSQRQVSRRETGVASGDLEPPIFSPEVTLASPASFKKRFLTSPLRGAKAARNSTPEKPPREVPAEKSSKSLRYSSPSKWLASLALAHIKPPARAESDVARARLRKSQECMKQSQEDVIAQLWQQVEHLKEINELKDQEMVEVANRAQRAEREAEVRYEALAQQSCELAELKARQLVMEMTALSASPDRADWEDTVGSKEWPSFAGKSLWTISEA